MPLDLVSGKRLLWHHLKGGDVEAFVCGPLLLRDFGADDEEDAADKRGAHRAFQRWAGDPADKFCAVTDAQMLAILPSQQERKQHRVPGACVWVSSRLALGFIAQRCSSVVFDQALSILRPAPAAAGGGAAAPIAGAPVAAGGGAGGAPAATAAPAAVAAAPAPAAPAVAAPAPAVAAATAVRARPARLVDAWRLLTATAKRTQLLALIAVIKGSRAPADVALRAAVQHRLDPKREPNIPSAALAGHADAARHHNARAALIWAAVAKIVARRRDATAPQTPRPILTPATPAPMRVAARAPAGGGGGAGGGGRGEAKDVAEQKRPLERKRGGGGGDGKEAKSGAAGAGGDPLPDAAPVPAAFVPPPCFVAPLCIVPRTFQVLGPVPCLFVDSS